jgi:hypothetical protein
VVRHVKVPVRRTPAELNDQHGMASVRSIQLAPTAAFHLPCPESRHSAFGHLQTLRSIQPNICTGSIAALARMGSAHSIAITFAYHASPGTFGEAHAYAINCTDQFIGEVASNIRESLAGSTRCAYLLNLAASEAGEGAVAMAELSVSAAERFS